jgi:GT2 family glycosyltransferase
MISIITAVHNGLAFNKIYLEYLRRYTTNPFELIIIDNASTDGTREFFAAQDECVVIANEDNYSYPFCQNQGIRAAKGEFLFFLNNDLIVSPQWDERLITALRIHNLDIISGAGIENLGEKDSTKAIAENGKGLKIL